MTDTTTAPAVAAPECRHHGPMRLRTEAGPDAAPTWHCADPACSNAVLRPADGTPRKGTLTITHTRAEGTILEGSRKGDGVFDIARRHRFWFSRALPGVLYVRQSRDKAADQWNISRAAEALRAAGWEVVVDIDEDTRRSFAEAEQDRYERAAERAARFSEYAGNAAARSEAHRSKARQIADSIPFGQPILVGHHSEGRARRDARLIQDNLRKSVTEGEKAAHYARRAKAAASYEAFRQNPQVTLRRIKRLEEELRRVEKWQRGEPAGGFTRALTPATVAELARWHEELTEEIGYWREVIAEAEKNGFKVWGPDDFEKGDFARVRGRWYEVLRVNKTTLTVPGGPDIQPVISLETHAYPGMRGRIPYDEVTARKSAEEMAEMLEAARQAKAAAEEGPASA